MPSRRQRQARRRVVVQPGKSLAGLSHSHHTYLTAAGCACVMGVEVKAGNEHPGSRTSGLACSGLDQLPAHRKPEAGAR
ncbi:MAG: hypothetical protein IPQ01_08100 [Zoogloea sp.]|nr:hypothetical protein [Zoogloea sp.]